MSIWDDGSSQISLPRVATKQKGRNLLSYTLLILCPTLESLSNQDKEELSLIYKLKPMIYLTKTAFALELWL